MHSCSRPFFLVAYRGFVPTYLDNPRRLRTLLVLFKKALWRLRLAVLSAVDGVALVVFPIKGLTLGSGSSKKVVLFLGDSLQPRIPRMAKWIARSGRHECALLVSSGKAYELYETECFVRVLNYRSRPQLRRILRGLSDVFVIHGFSIPSYPVSIALEEATAPVVADFQDMYVSYFGLASPKRYMRVDMPNERFCVEHANGLVSQSLELAQATRTYGIAKRPPTLFFPVYCDEDNFAPERADEDLNDPHIVYAGSVAGSFQDDQHFGSMKFHHLIRVLEAQRIHFHLYPSPAIRFSDLILAEYRSIERSSRFFHLHEPIPQNRLGAEFSKYHFGILPFFLEDTGRGPDKLGGGSSQKLFNYIEAGIPVIISEDLRFQTWMARRYGAALSISKSDLPDLRRLIDDLDYTALKRKLYRTRSCISLGHNITRLLAFYDEIQPEHSKTD